ncbi:OB-fold-containig protein [Sphingorhabdus sp. EL138]|uniref:OB-fold-containig protein n=1 Tax=Sphingorhabdus sp. EL138 TaxID=2073156 RepID=UPI000D69FB4B|nr:OB-fold-containig protein [Sphingorhabdus sp. EL138]
MIEFWLADENIFFSAAILLMFAIGILQLVGLSDFGPDFGTDMDPDADIAEAGVDGAGEGLLSLLGFGRLPFLMLLVLFLALFGIIGLAGQEFYSSLFGWLLTPWLAVPAATAVSLPLTGLLARPLSRIIPSDETTAIDIDMLVGRRGKIEIGKAETGSPARAKVIDLHGQGHFVMVEPANEGEIFRQAEEVLLVRREEGTFKIISPDTVKFLE